MTHAVHQPLPSLEELEAREMLSAVTFDNGLLSIQGDANKANSISVTLVKEKGVSKLRAVAGKSKLTVAVAAVLAMKITGGSKVDVINISPAVKVPAYIDAGAGNDVIRTGGGNDTVIGGAGNDTIVNQGGADSIYGGAGTNTVRATKRDTVYAGTGRSVATGAKNLSLTNPDPVIPAPPDTQKPVTQQPQSPVSVVQQPPSTPTGSNSGSNTGTQTNPPAPQDPGAVTGGGSAWQPPAVQTYGPTIDPRTYGAKLDGVTDDTAAIQAAMNALPATGGTLVLNGMAAIGSAGVVVAGKNHITIIAGSQGAGFRALSATTRGFGGFSSALLLLQSDTNSTVAGITIDGNNQPVIGIGLAAVSNSTITGNEIYHTAGTAAIASSGGTSNTYSSNSIHDTPSQSRGMWIGNSNNDMELSPLITGNTILRTGATGISTLSHNAIITNNTSSYTAGAGLALAGVTSYTTENAYVGNNVMNYNGYQGIQADAWSTNTPVGACTIENNTCNGNAHSGIYVARATGWTVKGNTCDNNGSVGGSGICVTIASHITVENNTCEDTRTGSAVTQDGGVELLAQAPGDVIDVTVQGNLCSGNRTAGVLVHNSGTGTMQTLLISSNTCTSNQQYGLFAVESSPSSITGVTLSGNTATGNAWDVRVSLASP